MVYYNEHDRYAAQWLRNLIAAGHIADGYVDERSIVDVRPSDLEGYTQCHFFAGIAVWSYALRKAGWPDNRPVWTGSCPCQPFSNAGKREGFADERHLWPHFHWLIQQCKPTVVLGEQVVSKAVGPWIDLVQTDVEALGYTFGCIPFPAASVGAPHIRDRTYWVANNGCLVNQRCGEGGRDRREEWVRPGTDTNDGGETDRMGDSDSGHGLRNQRKGWGNEHSDTGVACGLENRNMPTKQRQRQFCRKSVCRQESARPCGRGVAYEPPPIGTGPGVLCEHSTDNWAGPVNGFWRAADWLFCRDGKWRPAQPGTQPLADVTPSRVGRLRAYGNAIVAEQAVVFVEAVMDVIDSRYAQDTDPVIEADQPSKMASARINTNTGQLVLDL